MPSAPMEIHFKTVIDGTGPSAIEANVCVNPLATNGGYTRHFNFFFFFFFHPKLLFFQNYFLGENYFLGKTINFD